MTIEKKTAAPPVDDGEYVLPSPPRGRGDVVVAPAPARRFATLSHGATVARAIGSRMVVQADGLAVLLAELRDRLSRLDASIGDATRAQLKGAVRELGGVVDWCDAVQQELAIEGERASIGHEPIDLLALCREVALGDEAPASISVPGERSATWWGDRAALSVLLQNALVLVAERSGGSGGRVVEIDVVDGVPCVRVRGRGEPSDGVDACTVDAFRAAVARVGATIVPDALGAGGAGFVVRLPIA